MLKKSFLMWSSLVNEGRSGTQWLSKQLNYSDEPIKPFRELFKSIFRRQREHTLPLILNSIKEQLGIEESEEFIQVGNAFRQEMSQILGDNGVLIFPSFPTAAPYHNISSFAHTFDFVYFGVINMLGFPATQCPIGLSSDGLPVGVQIVSNRYNDHLTIHLAKMLEAELGGWIRPF